MPATTTRSRTRKAPLACRSAGTHSSVVMSPVPTSSASARSTISPASSELSEHLAVLFDLRDVFGPFAAQRFHNVRRGTVQEFFISSWRSMLAICFCSLSFSFVSRCRSASVSTSGSCRERSNWAVDRTAPVRASGASVRTSSFTLARNSTTGNSMFLRPIAAIEHAG